MARINLLPWRQEERERKNKEFNVIAAAAAALAVLAVLAAMTFLGQQLSNQQAANDLIRNENTRLDGVNKEIEGLEQQRDEMISRLKVIQDLQGQRSVPVRVWDDIARALPQSMYLIGMKREGDIITLTGFADNPNVVSQLIRNLDASPWLTNSGVPNIKTEDEAYKDLRKALNDLTTKENRPIYPEDSYMEFVVTTQVKPDDATTTETNAEAATVDNALNQPVVPNANNTNQVTQATSAPAQSATQQPTQPVAQQPNQPQQPAQAANTQSPAQPNAQANPNATQTPPPANGQPPVQTPPPVATAPTVAEPQTGGQ